MEQDSHAILHTLGRLYAEAGKTKEAYDVLIQAMDLQDLDEPNPDFWYAFGRIAEQYGERGKSPGGSRQSLTSRNRRSNSRVVLSAGPDAHQGARKITLRRPRRPTQPKGRSAN